MRWQTDGEIVFAAPSNPNNHLDLAAKGLLDMNKPHLLVFFEFSRPLNICERSRNSVGRAGVAHQDMTVSCDRQYCPDIPCHILN